MMGPTFPLNLASEGEVLTVARLSGGKGFRDKCIDQGILPGNRVEILTRSSNGQCLLLPNGSKIVMGHGMLKKIYVSP